MFPTNVGTLDRILRIVLGLAILALGLANGMAWWGWLGVIPLATGLAAHCPAYDAFGISTIRKPPTTRAA